MKKRITPGSLGLWSNGDIVFYLYDVGDVYSSDMRSYEFVFSANMTHFVQAGWNTTINEVVYE